MAERNCMHPFGSGDSEKGLGHKQGKQASQCFPTSTQCFANVVETDRSLKFWEFHLGSPVMKLHPLDSAWQEGSWPEQRRCCGVWTMQVARAFAADLCEGRVHLSKGHPLSNHPISEGTSSTNQELKVPDTSPCTDDSADSVWLDPPGCSVGMVALQS